MQENKNDKSDKLNKITKNILYNLSNNDIKLSNHNSEDQDSLQDIEEFEGLDDAIEQLLGMLSARGDDLSKLQSMLILIINKYLSSKKVKSSKLSKKEREQIIKKEVAKASVLILEQYTRLLKKASIGIDKEKDPYLQNNKFARAQLKKLIKTFAVYEIYKVMTPRRIAGETKLDNFIHNVLSHHDVKYATRFTGGKTWDIAGYSTKVKNTLKMQNVKNKQLLGK